MNRLGVILLNDTSGRSHHGCARVMRLLERGLVARGLTILHRVPAHGDWRNDPGFAAALPRAALLVINGEGTLHHGRPAGETLLHVIAQSPVPVAVVNALWQDNPASWAEMVAGAALIATRDGQSAQALGAALGRPVRCLPDLSLSDGADPQPGPRQGVIFGDHVRWSGRQALARASRRLGGEALVPTKTAAGAWDNPVLRWFLSGAYHGVSPLGLPPLRLAPDEAAYLAALGRARIHVTGRFHGICLSMVTGTPFLALASNSWKIEALLADAGLPKDRIISPEALAQMRPQDIDRPFSAAETAGLAAFLTRAKAEAARLFDDLAALAGVT